jgi:hypothetical protein
MSSPVWPQGSESGGTARVFEIDANTMLHWLMEAAEQLQAFSAYFLRDLRLHQVQLDELYAGHLDGVLKQSQLRLFADPFSIASRHHTPMPQARMGQRRDCGLDVHRASKIDPRDQGLSALVEVSKPLKASPAGEIRR